MPKTATTAPANPFGQATPSASGATDAQMREVLATEYLTGRSASIVNGKVVSGGGALNPGYLLSPTAAADTPMGQFTSPNPTTMASAFNLPPNAGSLQMASGYGGTTAPVSTSARNSIDQGVAMVTLYGAFESGKPLTPAELRAAQNLGGDVARAAELVGTTAPNEITINGQQTDRLGPAKKKNNTQTERAVLAAQKELAQRIQTTLGVPVSELSKQGLSMPAPPTLVNMLQQAGYGVTQNMNLQQAIATADGQKGAPSSVLTTPQTVAQFIQGLSNGQSGQSEIASLQKALFKGGFYDQAYTSGTKSYTPGNLDTGTVLAFRNAILQTMQANAEGKPTTLADTINAGDTANGPLLGSVAAKPAAKITVATQDQMLNTLQTTFEKVLGRLPTEAELANFTQEYANAQLQHAGPNQNGYDAQGNPMPIQTDIYNTGAELLPGVATPANAAVEYAQSNNTEYMGHQLGNAAQLLDNIMKAGGNPANANAVTAGGPTAYGSTP